MFFIAVFLYVKMLKRVLLKKKKSLQKRQVKDIKIFLKKKKKRSVNMVINNIKIF